MGLIIIVLELIQLTGPDNQMIQINPQAIVSLRAPRGTDHVNENIHCLINTNDGKFITVVEECGQIINLLSGFEE